MPRTHRLTRRATLAGISLSTVALAVGGCTLRQEKSPAEAVRADPLGPLYTETTTLIGTYDEAIASYPALSPIIGRLRDEHRQHAVALAALIGIVAPAISPGPDASGISASPSAPPSAPASPPASTSPLPTDPIATAPAALRESEKIAQVNAVAACMNAPGDRVAVLASIAACRATHVAALAGLR